MRRLTVLLTVAVILGVAAPSNASTFGYNQLKVKEFTRAVSILNGATGRVAVSCPVGTTIVNGGAFFARNGQNPAAADADHTNLTASFASGRRWIAAGNVENAGSNDELLHVVVHCTARRLAVRSIREDSALRLYNTQVSHDCPGTTQPLFAGGYWHRSGSNTPETVDVFLSADAAIVNTGWITGANLQNQHLVLTLVMRCTSSFGPLLDDSATQSVALGHAGANFDCPAGMHIINGGAFWSADGVTPSEGSALSVSGSSPKLGDAGWFGAGRNDTSVTFYFTRTQGCLSD